MSPAIRPAPPPKKPAVRRSAGMSAVEAIARDRLRHHPHFRGHERDVRIEVSGDRLLLTGRLPSFYLKQLLQASLQGLPGVAHIDNGVDVVRCDGVSSEPLHGPPPPVALLENQNHADEDP